jgi:predicted anti-sigma-YlaC factor YlaD
MSVLPRSTGMLCDRAREWASLRLDGELSELEAAMLDGHLARCAACAAVVAETEAITNAVRRSPLLPLARPISTPRRHVAFRAARVTAAAAVMLVAAGLGSVFATSVQTPVAERAAVPQAINAGSDDRQLRDMRRAQLQVERAMLQTDTPRRPGFVL